MTTTANYRHHNLPTIGAFAFIMLIIALLAIPATSFVAGYVAKDSTVTLTQDDNLLYVNATILEVVSGHAWQNHGTEVNAAIKCLNNNGSTRSFKTTGFFDVGGKPILTNLWLCQDGDDWFAIVTTYLEKVGGNRIGRLVTAYLVDKKMFFTVEDFVAKVVEKWSAVQINFKIEPGSIYLQPR